MTVTEESYSCTCSLRGARWLIFSATESQHLHLSFQPPLLKALWESGVGMLLSEFACASQTAMEWTHQRFLREIIEALLKTYQQKVFVTHTVDDLLWGYKDEILSLIHTFKPEISPYFGLYYGVSGFFLFRASLFS